MQLLCDTFQTFPSFIYLIPVIMLFQVGDVAAITAIVIYAAIPIVRYTIFGLRGVPNETIEAAITAGCTPRQILWKVRMPLAFPEIMLGVNQTIMFALQLMSSPPSSGPRTSGGTSGASTSPMGKGLVKALRRFLGLTVIAWSLEWSGGRGSGLWPSGDTERRTSWNSSQPVELALCAVCGGRACSRSRPGWSATSFRAEARGP